MVSTLEVCHTPLPRLFEMIHLNISRGIDVIAGTATKPNKGSGLKTYLARFGGWRELVVIVFFLGLALAFTWPLALHFREAIPGDGQDGWQMVWNLWWVRYALEHGQNPFQTDLLFYPQGTGLYLHALNALNGLLSLPVQYLAGGAVAGYNFIVLFSLTFAAYGAFCLARYLWSNSGAALIAGVAFGFSTYHFAHLLGHLNLLSSEFMPYYILFFLKALNTGKLRPALLAVFTLICGILLELQYVLYMAIFSVAYLFYLTLVTVIEKRRNLAQIGPKLVTSWSQAGLIAGLFLLLTLPLTIPMLGEALNNPNTVPPRQDSIYSADALAYFYPSPFHPLWGGSIKAAMRPWTATLIEKVVFPGYTLYLLALIGAILSLTRRRYFRAKFPASNDTPAKIHAAEWKPGPFFWVLVVLLFGLLSFGQQLHVNGQLIGPTLPAALIYKLPILNITRVPSRYAIMAILALSLLASWGMGQLSTWLRVGVKFRIINGLALLVLVFELWPAPYPLAFYSVPQFYRGLAADQERYAILDLPMNVGGEYQYLTDYLKAQMEHHKPLLGGYISRNPVYPPFYGVPVFWEFSQFQSKPRPDILPPPTDEQAVLRYFGVRHVIVHKDLVRGNRQEAILGLAFRLFPQGPMYEAENLVVFEVPRRSEKENKPLFFANLVQPTWYEAEQSDDKRSSRWVQGSKAGLDLWSDQPRTLEITLPLWSFYEKHLVDFVFNGVSQLQREIGEEPQQVLLKLELKLGRNRLDLVIGGKANRPAELGPGNDTRLLTIAVGEITIRH
ncbi:MAG: hypothetical protein WCS37_05395 [Chloroflexota bacterium]